ncbi:MAG: hypothetical protein KGZ40_05565 [Clostridiales bacterium]|nr:hypothetical protein [Clostridiales bacterium]
MLWPLGRYWRISPFVFSFRVLSETCNKHRVRRCRILGAHGTQLMRYIVDEGGYLAPACVELAYLLT